MQNQETPKRSIRWTILISIAGALMLLFTCAIAVGSLFLDFAGEETAGTLKNVAKCSGSDTCFTAQISFQTSDGKSITYLPLLQNSSIYEIHRLANLANDIGKSSSAVEVHYFEAYPRMAKVSLSYYVEYLNILIWLFWSLVVAFIGGVINRTGKPITLDFRKRK